MLIIRNLERQGRGADARAFDLIEQLWRDFAANTQEDPTFQSHQGSNFCRFVQARRRMGGMNEPAEAEAVMAVGVKAALSSDALTAAIDRLVSSLKYFAGGEEEKALNILHLSLDQHVLAMPRTCAGCREVRAEETPMVTCSACRVARYCSKEHQKLDFRQGKEVRSFVDHKTLCPLLKDWRLVIKGKQTTAACQPAQLAFLRANATSVQRERELPAQTRAATSGAGSLKPGAADADTTPACVLEGDPETLVEAERSRVKIEALAAQRTAECASAERGRVLMEAARVKALSATDSRGCRNNLRSEEEWEIRWVRDAEKKALARRIGAARSHVVDDVWHVSVISAGYFILAISGMTGFVGLDYVRRSFPARVEVTNVSIPKPACPPRCSRANSDVMAQYQKENPPPRALVTMSCVDNHLSPGFSASLREAITLCLLQTAQARNGIPQKVLFGPFGAVTCCQDYKTGYVASVVENELGVGVHELQGCYEGNSHDGLLWATETYPKV